MNSDSDQPIQQNLPLYDSDFSIEEQHGTKKLLLKQAIDDIQNDPEDSVDPLGGDGRTVTLESKPLDFPEATSPLSIKTPATENGSSTLKLKASSPGLKLKSLAPESDEVSQVQEAPRSGLLLKTPLSQLEPESTQEPSIANHEDNVTEPVHTQTDEALELEVAPTSNEAPQDSPTPATTAPEIHTPSEGTLQIKHPIRTKAPEPEKPSFDSELPFMTEAPPQVEAVEAHERILDEAAESSLFMEEEVKPQVPEANSETIAPDTPKISPVAQPELIQTSSNRQVLEELDETQSNEPAKISTIYEYDETEGLGHYLIHARTERSLTVRELSSRTRIKEAWILALEEENLDELPEPVYTKSSLKNLCVELKISYETTLRLYSELTGGKHEKAYDFKQQSPDPHAAKNSGSAVHKWSAIFMGLTVIGIIVAGFLIKYIFKAEPYMPEGYVINLDEFHPEIKVPTPRLKIPQY